jgi:hypothetical protein
LWIASLGELWFARGDPVGRASSPDQCLELATRSNSRKYLVRGWRLRGEIALARRQPDEANGALREALTIAEAIGNPTQLWKTHVAFGRLHAAAGRIDEARDAYRAARAVIDGIKANLQTPALRECLERAPRVREVYS